ncbi:MAG: hypothetical protein CMB80_07040 [Flammeovirgaceae bacterium]|nr:hypothetical protein [Flammeovirgaceae bacterium]MBE62942.1 hypothetical protein [Flammeovirgaceae bacterium]HCX20785.1 hypothetical protein [Cytophagales bacterium]|tara:strand:- start:12 stop:665 length:654 start_codon:yes stop_codon:yes gene_type:complete
MSNQQPQLVSSNTIKQLIGWTALLFPALLIILSFASGRCESVQETISHYYYSIVGNVFVGALSTISILLIIYKGYPNSQDFIVTTIAGIGGLGVAMFPTTIPCDLSGCIVVSLNDVDVSTIHYISALIMFAALAYMCLVLFRKKSANPTNQKITRNWIYLINGILIVLSIIAIYLFQTMWDAEKLCNTKIVLILEWVALANFGFSWMVKGGLFLKDK